MRTSEEGIRFIKQQEGLELQVYRDVAGYATVGYGHLILPSDPQVEEITKEEADRLLAEDLIKAELCVELATKSVILQQHEFDALVSFVFNVGCGAFNRSTLLKELLACRFREAGSELLRWNKAGGKVVKGLTNRRRFERHLFLTGEYL